MRKLVFVLIGLMALFTIFRAANVFADKKSDSQIRVQELAESGLRY